MKSLCGEEVFSFCRYYKEWWSYIFSDKFFDRHVVLFDLIAIFPERLQPWLDISFRFLLQKLEANASVKQPRQRQEHFTTNVLTLYA